MDWFQRATRHQSLSSQDQGLVSCCFSCFHTSGRPVPHRSQGTCCRGRGHYFARGLGEEAWALLAA